MASPKPIRWGVMGTGAIASDFTQVLQQLEATEVVAVGSRTQASADRFGAKFEIPRRHGSYEALAADPSIDVVYVATPSLRHVDDCLLALRHGKHVLCEKSMAPGADDAAKVLAEAKARGCFFLHGVWSRFFPAMVRARAPKRIASGEHVCVCGAVGSGVARRQ